MNVLIAPGQRMTKKLTATPNGWEVEGYDRGAQTFTCVTMSVESFDDLADNIDAVRTMTDALIIRGRLKDGVDPGEVFRRYTHVDQSTNDFEANPGGVPWVMIDFDKLKCPEWFSRTDRLEFLISHLPPEFHDASYVYQWSSSEGIGDPAIPRAHIWFHLAEPITCAVVKGKAVQERWPCDTAPFNPVQAHYVADPVIVGADDPLDVPRFGVVRKAQDSVLLGPWIKPKPLPRIAPQKRPEGPTRRFDEWLDKIGNPSLHEAVRGACASYFSIHGHDADERFLIDALSDRINESFRSGSDRDRCLRDLPLMVSSARSKFG